MARQAFLKVTPCFGPNIPPCSVASVEIRKRNQSIAGSRFHETFSRASSFGLQRIDADKNLLCLALSCSLSESLLDGTFEALKRHKFDAMFFRCNDA